MTWKNILKIDMKEARRLGNTYAGDEMSGHDVERIILGEKKTIFYFKDYIDWLKNYRNQKDLLHPSNIESIEERFINELLPPAQRPQINNNMTIKEIIQIAEKVISEKEQSHKKYEKRMGIEGKYPTYIGEV